MVRQKKLPKTIALTDSQIRRLGELSEFDGLDPVEHARKAIDEYLTNQNLDFSPPKEKDIVGLIKERTADPIIDRAFWVTGIVDKYEFSALILSGPSKSGIEKGRISKLAIWDPETRKRTNNFIASCIVNFDKGWDKRPSRMAQPYYDKVKSLIDNAVDSFVRKIGKGI